MDKRHQKRRTIRIMSAGVSSAIMSALIGPVFGQGAKDMAPSPAVYAGSDRQQKLIAGAKKEGNLLTIYTSAPPDDMAVITGAFEKKYGIKVKVWRSASENVLQRAIAEAGVKRYDVDIVDTNGPELESLHRENLLQPVASPYLADLIKPAIMPHGEWVGTRLNIFTQAYNSKLVRKEELPRTYNDLLDPKWKGKIAIEAGDLDWFASVVSAMGEAKGLALFRDIVAVNGISIRKGHTLLCNLVASGEVPLALTIYNYKAEQMKRKGAPIDWFVIGAAYARPNGIGMLRRAPHANAAVLYYDFVLAEAQELMPQLGYVPVSRKIETPLTAMTLEFIDPLLVLDQFDKWKKLYDDTFIKRAS
jgi:iron(III) transport system substrate-binding protein